jgi:hypothetical protein
MNSVEQAAPELPQGTRPVDRLSAVDYFTANPHCVPSEGRRTMAAQHPESMPPWRSSASADAPSQVGSSLEAKPDQRNGPSVPRLLLNDGNSRPQVGFGVWQIDNAKALEIIGTAINACYRLIDTAANYGNEAAVGHAIKRAAVPRHEISVTTKLRNEAHGYDQTMRAFDLSVATLGSWRAFIELKKNGP